jgi:ketosteroid isomerase-like protein
VKRLLAASLLLAATASAEAPVPVAPSPTAEVVDRLVLIASKGAHTTAAPPQFTFSDNVTLEHPASWAEATVGMPEIVVADKTKTLAVLVDPDTAYVSTHLGEYSTCGKQPADCAKQAPDEWVRATVLFEKSAGEWQPTAWAITPPIPGTSQQEANEQKIVPDAFGRNTAGADDVARQFETTLADPKAFAATFSNRKEVVMFGSELAERYVGAKAKAQITSWGFKYNVRDGLRAGMSKSGNVAWVAANVDAVSVKHPKNPALPFRLFALYEKTGGAWKVVQLQFSTSV